MDKVYIKVAVVHFFFCMIIRFGWSLALAFTFLFLSIFNDFFFPLFVAFVAFDIIASIIESFKLFFHMRRVKNREYPLAEKENGEPKLYYDPENPRSIRGRMWEKELREKVSNDSSLEACVAAFEEMCGDIKDELASLEKKLTHNTEHDLNHFKKNICELITQELALRWFYQKGGVLERNQHDKVIDEAIRVLNSDEYTKILSAPAPVKKEKKK